MSPTGYISKTNKKIGGKENGNVGSRLYIYMYVCTYPSVLKMSPEIGGFEVLLDLAKEIFAAEKYGPTNGTVVRDHLGGCMLVLRGRKIFSGWVHWFEPLRLCWT